MSKRPFLSRVRGALDIMANGYDGAHESRNRTHYAYNRSPALDEDNVIGAYDRTKIGLEGRDMVRNHAIVHGASDRLSSYAIGPGLSPQANTSSRTWNTEAESWWNQIYTNTCDYRQQQGVTLATFQKMNITERLTQGEVGYILLSNGQLQPIEAPRIVTPNKYQSDKLVTQGVRRTKGGIVVGYYVSPRKSGGTVDTTKYKYVKRENFVHCWEPTRPDMVRGIPDLAPLINKLRDYDETDENVLNKIKADAANWMKRKRHAGGSVNDRNLSAYKRTNSDDENPQRVEKVDGLRILNMQPDEDVEAYESKTPHAHYVDYLEHELRVISQCLNLPFEFMMLIFTAGSYSAQRAAMIHAHHTIMDWVEWDNRVFNRRIWNWRVAKAMNNGELPLAPVDANGISEWWKVEWSLPAWREIDADKQAKGDLAYFKMGRRSLKSIIRSDGRDRDDVFREKAEDLQRADEIGAAYGVKGSDIIDVSITKSAPLPGSDIADGEDE